MAVDPVHGAAGAGRGEQVPEQAVAAEIGLTADDRQEGIGEMRLQRPHRRADAAEMRRAVEGRAAFVMQQTDAEPGKEAAGRVEFGRHRLGSHRPRRAGNAERVEDAGASELLGRRNAQEEQRLLPALGEHRERIGRAGEIVAIPGVTGQRSGHGSSARRLAEEGERLLQFGVLLRRLRDRHPAGDRLPGLADAGDASRRPAGMGEDAAARHEQ